MAALNLQSKIALNNGLDIPVLGYGVSRPLSDEMCVSDHF